MGEKSRAPTRGESVFCSVNEKKGERTVLRVQQILFEKVSCIWWEPISSYFDSFVPTVYTAVFTSKYNSKIRGALKDLELQADLVHKTTSGA